MPRFLLSTATAPPPDSAVESDFVVILAALLCALICVVGLVAVARCAWLRRSGGPNPTPNKGLKKKALNSLPKTTYNEDDTVHANLGECCAICLAEYVSGEEVRVLPSCGHGFHVSCIDTWLGSHSSCPSCRQILVVSRCKKCGEVSGGNREGGEGGREGVSRSGGAGFLPF